MLQTQFCGSDYKFVISWNALNNENYNSQKIFESDENLFYKLDELYQNISKFSTEFVECIKQVQSFKDVQSFENNPNVSFKIENTKNTKSYSDEVFLLRKEVEKLKNENDLLQSEYESCITFHNEELLKLKREREIKFQELENKYKLEMSDLRIYFEKSYTDYLKQLTEVISNQYTHNKISDGSSNSENELGDENYGINNHIKEIAVHDDVNKLEVIAESKIKIKENIDKDLKNIMKAYNTEINKFKEELIHKKDNEVREVKENMETKYLLIIEAMQTEINNLSYDKALENKVKEIHAVLKEDCETEIQNLQNDYDQKFIEKIQNEKKMLETQLKSKFQTQLHEIQNEWQNQFEELLSDVLINSAIKTVSNEIYYNGKYSLYNSSSKKFTNENKKIKYKENEKHLQQKFQMELNEMQCLYENRIQNIISNYEKTVQEFSDEKLVLLSQINELKEINEKYKKETDILKANFVKELENLQADQEIDVDKIKEELTKMKIVHETEVAKLEEVNVLLEKKIHYLQDKEQCSEHVKRREIILLLQKEIEDLIIKEQNGDYITWPAELETFIQLFLQKFQIKNVETEYKIKDLFTNEVKPEESVSEKDLNEIIKERDGLKKINVALNGVVKVFTKYLTNCEEELNNTLIGELLKIDPTKKKLNNSCFDDVTCEFSSINGENIKKVHFVPDISEVMSLLSEEQSLSITNDHNISVIESELNACLERLKNEAAAVLCLTTGKKNESEELKSFKEIFVQTDFDGVQIEQNQEKIRLLEKQVIEAEKEISELSREVTRLTEKINSLESIEGYGEGLNSTLSSECFPTGNINQASGEYGSQYGEEFCAKCDKIIEEAKKEIEDRESQLQAVTNKFKSLNQFLERQTAERENERTDFDKKLEKLKEQSKDRERELYSKYEAELINFQQQIKKLTMEVELLQQLKDSLETKLKFNSDTISKLRELNEDLENASIKKSNEIKKLEEKLKEGETELLQCQNDYHILVQQLENMPDGDIKQLEELSEQHVISSALIEQMKNELFEVEKLVTSRTRELENTYLSVVSSTVISSPSEDVSVCDRIRNLGVMSPNESDLSSSPVHVPINHLSCLNDKINRLIKAEEAALKKMKDQDLQLNKLSDSIATLELEKGILQENLSSTSEKLSEAKIELNNWQHGHVTMQSEIQLELSRTIESLESRIEYYEKFITQKDMKISELNNKIKSLENYISNIENDFKETIHKNTLEIDELKSNLEIQSKKKEKLQELLLKYQNTDISASAQCNLINSSESIESYTDSDVSRNAVITEISTVPHYISFVSSSHVPYLNVEGNETLSNLPPVKYNNEIGVEHFIPSYKNEQTEKDGLNNVDFTDSNLKENEIPSPTDIKYDEISFSLKQIERELDDEKNKSKKLTDAIQLEKESYIELQSQINTFKDKIEQISFELKTEKETVKNLTNINEKLEEELEQSKQHEAELNEKLSQCETPSVEDKESSLKNLTDKVQKEVERAEELDQNILKSLESDSRSFSFIDELMKISSTISDELKRVLFKLLQEGPQELTIEEKNMLINSCNLHDTNMIDIIRQHNDEQKQLQMQLDIEQNSNKKLLSDIHALRMELNRLEMILGYYDERMSFLIIKLDEYRNKAVKIEIELTSEKTARRQLELSLENHKKEALEKQNQCIRKIEECTDQLNVTVNENLKLRQEIESMKITLETLTAELNSVKIITQYHSDSDSDLSRSLNPLKGKLNELQEKYSKCQYDLERKKNELYSVKCNLNFERSNKQKLENMYKIMLEEKHDLHKQLVDIEKKFEDLNWQKQKLEDKLKAAELAEMKRRKLRIGKEGAARKEYEAVKEEQYVLEKECNRLKKYLFKIKDDFQSLQNDWKRICEESQNIFTRMLRAEHNQRSLVFQKNYLIIIIKDRYLMEYNTLTDSNVNTTNYFNANDYIYCNISGNTVTPKMKFKSYVFCIITINRMRFFIKRRLVSNHTKMVNYFKNYLPGVKIYPWCTRLSSEIYKEDCFVERNQPERKKKKIKKACPEKTDNGEDDSFLTLYEKFTDLHNTFMVKNAKNTD